jgi:ribosome-associated protein
MPHLMRHLSHQGLTLFATPNRFRVKPEMTTKKTSIAGEKMAEITSKKLASAIARILDEKLAQDIIILNISGVSVLTDYFVIASGSSSTQVKALTEAVREKIKDLFARLPQGSENDAKNKWNLLDYGDVVAHIMHQEQRETYALEKFWNHALKVDRKIWEEESKEFKVY